MNNEPNTLYVSDKLIERHNGVWEQLSSKCSKFGVRFREIKGTKDIWCRDFMPIQVSENKFIQFNYKPSYLDEAPEILTTPKDIQKNLGGKEVFYSSIKLDGGNIVSCGEKTIITSKVFSDNPNRKKNLLIDEVSNLLESEIIIIPTEPGDILGHADGMVKFIDEKRLFVNDYTKAKVSKSFLTNLESSLSGKGITTIPFPYLQSNRRTKDGLFTAHGCYINYIKLGNLILVPSFNEKSDADVNDIILKEYGFFPEFIDSNELAFEGGLLNCITWSIYEKSRFVMSPEEFIILKNERGV